MKQDYKTSVPPKDLESSRKERAYWLAKWKFEPISFMILDKIHDPVLDAIVEDTLSKNTYEKCNYNVRSGALPQTSTTVIERFIRFYSEPNEVVLNPMCERAPVPLIANYLGRQAIGQDICKAFVDHDMAKVKRRLLQNAALYPENNVIYKEDETHLFTKFNGLRFDLTRGDSRHLDLPDNSVDYINTSPPYYNIGIYGEEEPEQIGRGIGTGKGDMPTYEEFLEGLQEIFKECFRVLKPNHYLTCMLNDFRLKGHFYIYHADCIRVTEELGFKIHDIVVYPISKHPIHSIFLSQLAASHRFAKGHEYALTFKKV